LERERKEEIREKQLKLEVLNKCRENLWKERKMHKMHNIKNICGTTHPPTSHNRRNICGILLHSSINLIGPYFLGWTRRK
jgi:hypothetical protein